LGRRGGRDDRGLDPSFVVKMMMMVVAIEMISSSLEVVVADVAATVMVESPLNPPHQVPLDHHHHHCYCCY